MAELTVVSEIGALSWSPWLPAYDTAIGLRRRAYLPVHVKAPRIGRHFVGAVLADWRLWQLADQAMTCASELVTNSLRHAAWPPDCGYHRVITVAMAQLAGGAVVVEVRDLDTRLPAFKPRLDLSNLSVDLTELTEGGEGLRVIAGLADEFGARLLPAGKSVWFVLST
jgi:anti-sigma regulatory factor (Ser/Thr protein kinase)